MSLELSVDEADAGGRLDAFLVRHVPGLSRAGARRVLEAGHVRVNGRRAPRGGVALEVGDRVTLAEAPPPTFTPRAPDGSVPLVVVYEDEALVIVDKPAGVPTHPLRPEEAATLVNALLAAHPEMAGVGYSPREPGIVHRLDNETSGLLIAARTAAAFDALRAALRTGAIEKRYEIVVEGSLPHDLRVIDAPLAKHPRGSRRVVAHLAGPIPTSARAARTEVLSTAPVGRELTRAIVRASVAKRHQIRAHFAAIGHPLVGDTLYGGGHREPLGRHYLHACALAFDHPVTGARVEVEAPRPPELERFLEEHDA